MLPRSHSMPRRRSALGPQLCAAAAALLLLLSLAVLHSRLSSSSSSPPSRFPHFPNPIISDSNSNPNSDSNSSTLLADEAATVNAGANPTPTTTTTDDELDVLEEDSLIISSSSRIPPSSSSLIWDHAIGAFRLPFRVPSSSSSSSSSSTDDDISFADLPHLDLSRVTFGSDDQPLDLELRVEISAMSSEGIEDALLLKSGSGRESPLRAGWARWLEGKADYLRRDRMLRSNLELLQPRNHPLLQDPDSPGLTSLTRGDRLIQRMLLADAEKTLPKNSERRTIHASSEAEKKEEKKIENGSGHEGRRWGYFPGIDPHLGFSEFMDRFLGDERCKFRVFMVWNSPQWTYGIRHQRGLESLLRFHRDACVVMLSETLELNFFREFTKEG